MNKKNRRKAASRARIVGLRWARFLDERPDFMPDNTKLRGAQRQGILYEKRVAVMLKAMLPDADVRHGQWIEYEDKKGIGWCQPDVIVDFGSAPLLVVECKLTATSGAFKQLNGFYLPTLAEIYGLDRKQVKLVQICKNLTPRFSDKRILEDMDEMLNGKWTCATLQMRRIPQIN